MPPYTKRVIVLGPLRAALGLHGLPVFVVVDLVVGAVPILPALGMSMHAPTTISVPFKLLLFVMLEGWTHLIQPWLCHTGRR